MKKFLAVLGIFATLFAFASCKKELTPEEAELSRSIAQSIAAAERESKIAASIKHEEDIVSDKAKTLGDIGKTEKGKQIVFKNNSANTQYDVITMDASGKAESWKRYIYYTNTESYEYALKAKDEGNFVHESHDDELRLIVTKNIKEATFKGTDYDTMLKNIKDFGYTVVE